MSTGSFMVLLAILCTAILFYVLLPYLNQVEMDRKAAWMTFCTGKAHPQEDCEWAYRTHAMDLIIAERLKP